MEKEHEGRSLEGGKCPLLNEGFLEGELNPRSKTSLRITYEAQVEVIRQQIGPLEEVREKLGLSQRKMAQLLMVDPSSWTRWTKKNDEAPPHVWRALQWYLIIGEKIPGLTPQYFVGRDPQANKNETLQELEKERRIRSEEMEKLGLEMQNEIQRVLLDREGLKNELALLKKDLKFHKNTSIVVLLISLAWAGIFFFGKTV